MKNESLWMKNKPLCIFIIAVLLFSVFILPWAIVLLEPDYSAEVESILSKYQKDDRYVIVYDSAYLKFNDRELNLYDLEQWYQFDKMNCFIDDSWIYFSGTNDDNRDDCSVKLFRCDHYGENFSVVFEKLYEKGSVNDYDRLWGTRIIALQDCCLQGYNLYIKHHSGNKEDKSSYALDVYNIETGEFKTILYGEEAYNFQVDVNMYKPQNGETGVQIDQGLVDQTELAKELKERGHKLLFLDTCYRNNEIYASCHIYTKSRYFKVFFKYNKPTEQLEFITWNFSGTDPSDILKIISK